MTSDFKLGHYQTTPPANIKSSKSCL